MFRAYLFGLTLLSLAACSQAGAFDTFKPTLYVQSVELPLRKEPQHSEKVATLPIGTRCSVLQEQGLSWLQLRCGEHTGYAYKDDFGPKKPNVDALLQAAADPALSSGERVELATRALALAPAHAEALAALKKSYLNHQFHLLKESSSSPVTLSFECAEATTAEDCLTHALLPQPLFGARMLERRGADFIGVGVQGRQLYAVRGTLKRSPTQTSRSLSCTVHSRQFGGADVPRVTEALGLKPAQELQSLPRYETNADRYDPLSRMGLRLSADDGAMPSVLIDLPNGIPSGGKGELREDLRLHVVLELLLVGDFDQDKRDDALVSISAMGACCAPCYLFASVSREGKPLVTNTFCTWKDPPRVGLADGKATFTITDDNGTEKTYVLARGKARQRP